MQTTKEVDLLRAVRALGDLDTYQYHRLNELYWRDSIIGYLKLRISELEASLEEANARIQELEGALSKEDTNEDQPV